MMKGMKEIFQELEQEGYVKIKDRDYGLSIKRLDEQMAKEIKECEFTNSKYKLGEDNSENLETYINTLYEHEINDECTSRIYQFMPSLFGIYEFLASKGVREIIRKAGVKSPVIASTPVVRIDRPKDNRYSTPWHQDSWYSSSEQNSIVIWIPLVKMSSELGYLQVEKASHKKGIVNFETNKKSKTELYEAVKDPSKQNITEIPIEYGEMMVFRQMLLHKSGQNRSNKCRVTLQIRINEMNKSKEPYSTFVCKNSEYVIENQKRWSEEYKSEDCK